MDIYKKAKNNLINKYSNKIKRLRRTDTELDSFITINDFLAVENSLGPNADPGTIHYTHSNYENINNYIKILMNEIGFNKIICLPDFSLKSHDNAIIRNTIGYNVTRNEMIIPFDLITEIKKCKKNIRFIYINLMIFWQQRDMTHVNMIIIDVVNHTIERYEPHGKTMGFDKNKKLAKNIDNKFDKKILSYLGLGKYKYISPIEISPDIGVQRKADAYYGMCLTYSLMYLQLRIMNPDINQKIIIKYMLSKSKKEIYDMVLQYAKYIEDKLKDYSDMVIKDLAKLYDNKNFYKLKKFILINKKSDIDFIEY